MFCLSRSPVIFEHVSVMILKGRERILQYPNRFNIQSQGFCPWSDLLYMSSIGAVFRSFGYETDNPEWCSDVSLAIYPGLAGNEILPSKEWQSLTTHLLSASQKIPPTPLAYFSVSITFFLLFVLLHVERLSSTFHIHIWVKLPMTAGFLFGFGCVDGLPHPLISQINEYYSLVPRSIWFPLYILWLCICSASKVLPIFVSLSLSQAYFWTSTLKVKFHSIQRCMGFVIEEE